MCGGGEGAGTDIGGGRTDIRGGGTDIGGGFHCEEWACVCVGGFPVRPCALPSAPAGAAQGRRDKAGDAGLEDDASDSAEVWAAVRLRGTGSGSGAASGCRTGPRWGGQTSGSRGHSLASAVRVHFDSQVEFGMGFWGGWGGGRAADAQCTAALPETEG